MNIRRRKRKRYKPETINNEHRPTTYSNNQNRQAGGRRITNGERTSLQNSPWRSVTASSKNAMRLMPWQCRLAISSPRLNQAKPVWMIISRWSLRRFSECIWAITTRHKDFSKSRTYRLLSEPGIEASVIAEIDKKAGTSSPVKPAVMVSTVGTAANIGTVPHRQTGMRPRQLLPKTMKITTTTATAGLCARVCFHRVQPVQTNKQ